VKKEKKLFSGQNPHGKKTIALTAVPSMIVRMNPYLRQFVGMQWSAVARMRNVKLKQLRLLGLLRSKAFIGGVTLTMVIDVKIQ